MSESPPSPAENGEGAPDPDRVRPISARPRGEPAPLSQGPGSKPQNGQNGAQGRPQSPAARERRPTATVPEGPPAESLPPESSEIRFADQGAEWVVRAVGQGTSGWGSGGSAPLVLLTFAHAERPEDPVREILCVGRGADRFSEMELAGLLQRAKPFAKSPRKQPIFSETRGKKGDL